jgi:3',5'-cyclic AMP phosphodiesterase CpdA
MTQEVLRIAAISDTHFGASESRHRRNGILTYNEYRSNVKKMSQEADVIIHCGDFTDQGDKESLKIAASIFSDATKPVLGVLGNHDIRQDFEMATEILSEEGGITLFDGNWMVDTYQDQRVGFIGMPGFQPRKDHHLDKELQISQQAYNEMSGQQTTRFRQEIRRVQGKNNIAFFHFDQIRSSSSEPETHPAEEIIVSEFAKLVDDYHYQVSLMLHGHDHRNIDRPATTPKKVRVENVAARINIEMNPGVPYRLIDVPLR